MRLKKSGPILFTYRHFSCCSSNKMIESPFLTLIMAALFGGWTFMLYITWPIWLIFAMKRRLSKTEPQKNSLRYLFPPKRCSNRKKTEFGIFLNFKRFFQKKSPFYINYPNYLNYFPILFCFSLFSLYLHYPFLSTALSFRASSKLL